MLQFYKVFSLVIRVFTKPLVTYTKQFHMARNGRQNKLSKRFFLYLGNKYYVLELMLNKGSLQLTQNEVQKLKFLPEETALEKGIEFFYEFMMYTILISLPLYEMYISSIDAKVKHEAIVKNLENLEEDIEEISKNVDDQSKQIDSKIKNMQALLENYGTSLITTNKNINENIVNNQMTLRKVFLETAELTNSILNVKRGYEKRIESMFDQNNELIKKLES